MEYALNKITTVQACDALLMPAQRKKQLLERNRRNLGETIDAFRLRMNRLGKELADVRSSHAALTTAYSMMPEGRDKDTIHIMIKRLELRQARLEKRAYTCNAVNLLWKELRYSKLDSQVAVMADYIEAINRLKSTLSQPIQGAAQSVDFSGTGATERGALKVSTRLPYPVTRRFERSGDPVVSVRSVGNVKFHIPDYFNRDVLSRNANPPELCLVQ